MKSANSTNWDKVLFFLFLGWIIAPMMWLGKKIGDVFHYDETPDEREQRHEIEAID